MQHTPHSAALYPIFSCGVDWITATAAFGGPSLAMGRFGDVLLHEERAAARDVKAAARLGYIGHSGEGFFTGVSPQGHLIILSGLRAARGSQELSILATNISRLDVQVTVFCGNGGPDLAQEAFSRLDAMDSMGRKPRNYSLLQSRPVGATLTINKRVSDRFGRLYDKASEMGDGPPWSLGRYELELKRKLAKALALKLAGAPSPATIVCDQVHRFFTASGVLPAFENLEVDQAGQRAVAPVNRDLRAWLRDSVSVTIAKAMSKFGEAEILRDLGLGHLAHRSERSIPDANSSGPSSNAGDFVSES